MRDTPAQILLVVFVGGVGYVTANAPENTVVVSVRCS